MDLQFTVFSKFFCNCKDVCFYILVADMNNFPDNQMFFRLPSFSSLVTSFLSQ